MRVLQTPWLSPHLLRSSVGSLFFIFGILLFITEFIVSDVAAVRSRKLEGGLYGPLHNAGFTNSCGANTSAFFMPADSEGTRVIEFLYDLSTAASDENNQSPLYFLTLCRGLSYLLDIHYRYRYHNWP